MDNNCRVSIDELDNDIDKETISIIDDDMFFDFEMDFMELDNAD